MSSFLDTNLLKDKYVNCLKQQLSEYELLKSMYPNHGEIMLTDKNIVNDINQFLDGKTEYIPNNLDFKFNLQVEEIKLEVFISLPTSYPDDEPDIYVRCNQLSRQEESCLNSDLSNYIKENYFGEVCLYTAISWLQENIEKFKNTSPEAKAEDTSDKIQSENKGNARLWIYSHHIYNKRKREDIVKKAKELQLNGFCLPGKPGIICIEGPTSDCNEWWRDIKSMSWKKIMIRKNESFDENIDYKKFSCFEELSFKTPGINKHANMSELSKYLNNLGLSQVFQELFGLSGDD